MKGRIFDIQRFSIHDGPGIRTTVFMKGCPLRCAWCHNPEGITPNPILSFSPGKCIGCGHCFRVCRQQAHRMEGDEHVLDRRKCVACGECVKGCRAGALELVGRDMTVDEVMAEVLRDKSFYETSGGGMTLSGGEPMHQIEFTAALLKTAKRGGLGRCVDTCALCPHEWFERIRKDVDLFLFDWKESDPKRCEELTGASNEQVLDNLRRLHDEGARIRLRCPIIPGVNDRDDHFAGIARIAGSLPRLEGVELMPYNRLGESKTERFGSQGTRRIVTEPPAPETVQGWIERLSRLGVNVLNET